VKLDRLHLSLGILLALGVAFRAVSRQGNGDSAPAAGLDRQIGAVTAKRASHRPPVAKNRRAIPKAAAAEPVDGLRRESTPVGALRPDASAGHARARVAGPSLRVNMDLADAATIESLPRIGPALAQRIVQDRLANGPFGSLAALDRVKGIGPSLQKHIAPYVTFSTSGRPSTVASIPRQASPAGRGKARQRPPGSDVP
jgi:DNA uptake protein ComE-like DNA-binding protein